MSAWILNQSVTGSLGTLHHLISVQCNVILNLHVILDTKDWLLLSQLLLKKEFLTLKHVHDC